MTTPACRCCGAELPYTYTAVCVSQVRPSATTSVTGRIAAAACHDCTSEVVDSILHVATLWTPAQPCTHHNGVLL